MYDLNTSVIINPIDFSFHSEYFFHSFNINIICIQTLQVKYYFLYYYLYVHIQLLFVQKEIFENSLIECYLFLPCLIKIM